MAVRVDLNASRNRPREGEFLEGVVGYAGAESYSWMSLGQRRRRVSETLISVLGFNRETGGWKSSSWKTRDRLHRQLQI